MSNTKEVERLHKQISDVAFKTVSHLQKDTKGDIDVAIASCAVAMCALARAEGILFNHLQDVLTAAFQQINED